MSQCSNKYSVLTQDDLPANEIVLPISCSSPSTESESEIMSNHPERVYIRSFNTPLSTYLPVQLKTLDTRATHNASGLLDCGATGLFIDLKYVEETKLNTRKLPRAIPVYNVDGTLNQSGSIKEEVDLVMTYQGHTEKATFGVCDLGDKEIIIGHTWLSYHNPEINWRTGEVQFTRCPKNCHMWKKQKKYKKRFQRRYTSKLPPMVEEVEEDESEEVEDAKGEEPEWVPGDRVFVAFLHSEATINATSTVSTRLAEQSKKDWEKKSFEDIVPKQYHNFKKVFSKESFDELPPRKPWDHAIELKPDSEPSRSKIYPLSPLEQAELDMFLDENLKSGRIRPSKSPMSSPVFFVKKKDGALRLIQDYRKLNDMTIKNSYPLPLISDLVNKLGKAKYFTKLDVRWGYNNVRIKEGDEWKAAFRTNRGLFEPLVMFFGLTNSPPTFQTMMDELFKDLIDEGVVIVYIDDILIFTEDLERHREVVRKVLAILEKHQLYLKPEKCEFEQEKVEYLGLIISQGKIEMDPVKLEGVSKWPVPENVTETQSFLGFTNFYRRFIQDFADIARPLHELAKKDVAFTWGSEQQRAFRTLKKALTSSPVLMFPQDDKPYKLEADSSGYATGAVLSQLGPDDKWHPVAYYSKSLTPTERNYDVHDKEMLAIMRGLEEYRHLLEGTQHVFEIWTDHKNLEYFMTAKKLNRRQARWSLYLSRFNFTMHHRPGKQSLKPDALSRRPDHEKGDNDNDNVILLKPDYFKIQALRQGHVLLTGDENGLLRRIRNSKEWDETVVKAMEELEKSGQRRMDGEEWSREQGLILFRGKVYVPKDMDLRRHLVSLHHDTPVTGHPGRWKTLELVTRNYWWPGISRYVASYVKGCDRCNRTKTFPAKLAGRLVPNPVPQDIWQIITVDLIEGLPESQGFDSIMVVVDRLSKMMHAIPTNKTVTSEGVARHFRDHVWKLHGLPEQVISDRGTQFVSGFMKELYTLLGIKMAPSTAYHPQTDGQTERVNQEIEQYLRVFVNHRQDDWAEWLPLAEFTHNNRIQASTRQTPFMLNSGKHPRMGVEPGRVTKNESVDNFVTRMKASRKEAEAALHQAAEDMARYYDRSRKDAVEYQVGDKVWLEGKDIKTNRPSKKLEDKRYGPYRITKVISPNAYKLQIPNSMRIHPVFNTVKLRPYLEDPIAERPQPERPAPVVVVDGEPEWAVEHLEDSRIYGRSRKMQYLVKWKGYPREENTWEDAENIISEDLINDFHRRHPSAPRRISAAIFQTLKFRPYENLTEIPNHKLFDWTQGRSTHTKCHHRMDSK
jgi:hypothetical protein